MRLHEWQTSFQHIVLGAKSIDALPLLEKNLSRERSMGIYANAYRERLHEALRSNYPALHQLLGDDDFATMAYAFTENYPSQHASIRWFGAELSNYLNKTPPYNGCAAIAELAQFEWALRHTVDAKDAERIDADYLQSLSGEQWSTLRCAIHPSLSILKFAWNAPQVWRSLDAGETPPVPTPLTNDWFVYRGRDLMSEWRSADANEVEALALWSRGENFSALCDFLFEKTSAEENGDANAAVAIAASYMRTWVEQGLLIHAVDV